MEIIERDYFKCIRNIVKQHQEEGLGKYILQIIIEGENN